MLHKNAHLHLMKLAGKAAALGTGVSQAKLFLDAK